MNRKIGVILSYVLMVFEVFSTLLLTPFIIRTLGQAEYGVYKLAAAINAYLLLLDLGVGNAVTRYVAKFRVENNKEQSEKFLGIATVYYLVIAFIAIIAGLVLVAVFPSAFAKGLTDSEIALGQKLLAITMVNSAVTLGSAAYNNVIIAYEKFAVSKGFSILQIILRIIMTFSALKLGFGSIGIVTVNLITTIICRAFFVFYVIIVLKLKPKFKGIEAGFAKEIVAYSSLILLQMVATQINSNVDQVLIGALVSSSAVILAVYGVGSQICQYFQSIGSAFTNVLMPGIVKMIESKASSKQITDEMIRIGRMVLIVLMLIWGGFIVSGEQFIILWAGKANEEAFKVALILMTAYVFILAESVGSQILWAMNEHKEQSVLKMAIVLANIVLTVLLIKWNPLIGATVGTFISLMAGDVITMNVIFVKKLKINLSSYYLGLFKGILPCTVLTVIIGFLTRGFFPKSWFGLLCSIAVMTVIYGAGMLLFGMNSYEKGLAKSMINKILKRS